MQPGLKEANEKPSTAIVAPESVTRIRSNMIGSKLQDEDNQPSTLTEIPSKKADPGLQRRESMGSDLAGVI